MTIKFWHLARVYIISSASKKFITTTRHTLKCVSKLCGNCTAITSANKSHWWNGRLTSFSYLSTWKSALHPRPVWNVLTPQNRYFLKQTGVQKAWIGSSCSLLTMNNQIKKQRISLQLVSAILIWRITEQDYGQYPMDCVRSQTRRRNLTLCRRIRRWLLGYQ